MPTGRERETAPGRFRRGRAGYGCEAHTPWLEEDRVFIGIPALIIILLLILILT